MQRRDLLKLSAAAFLFPATGIVGCSLFQESRFFSAVRRHGKDHIAGFNASGELSFIHSVAERCHGVAYDPHTGETAWPARSPGTHLYMVDHTGELIRELNSEEGYHFYGHAQFTSDGRFLLTTENHYATGEGRIAVRDRQQNFSVVRDFHSGGIGPHEFRFLSDGFHIAVANGGILTRPDVSGKLNLDSMQPSLAIIDFRNGGIKQQMTPPHHQLSVRHMAVNSNDQVAVLFQYQGREDQNLPLIAWWEPGKQALAYPKTPDGSGWSGYQRYMASGVLTDEGVLAVSTPRGNRIGFWNLKTNDYIAEHPMKDVAGLALSRDKKSILASSGRGRLWQFSASSGIPMTEQPASVPGLGWDNHMLAV